MVSTTASQQSFELVVDEAGNVRTTTVAQHFSQRYGIELTYVIHILKRGLMTPTDRLLISQRDMPLVVVLGREQRLLYYPAEICYVCDNQRVKTQQMLPQMTQKMIKVRLPLCPNPKAFILFTLLIFSEVCCSTGHSSKTK
jgi:hypothetical protein